MQIQPKKYKKKRKESQKKLRLGCSKLENMSRIVHFVKVGNKKSQTVKEAILKILRGKDAKSITYDNGSENVLHE